jgi:acyl carrier protein
MQSSFTLDLGMTSYDLIEMCALLEEQFQVEIEDEVLPTLESVGNLVHYLEKNTNFEK